MSFRAGESFVEGEYRFTFAAGYKICRVECSRYYSCELQNFCHGCKEMDFIAYHPEQKDLWLIEVKDYRFNARPKVKELSRKLVQKLRDCLFLLKVASTIAPQEYPEEGVSLRDMARMCANARRIRVAYTIELGSKGFYPPLHLLVGIRDIVYKDVRAIDPHMLCLPITRSGGAGPWRIAEAKGEKSARRRR